MTYEYHRLYEPYRHKSIRYCSLKKSGQNVIDSVIKLNKINTEIRLREFELRLNELQRINNKTRKKTN